LFADEKGRGKRDGRVPVPADIAYWNWNCHAPYCFEQSREKDSQGGTVSVLVASDAVVVAEAVVERQRRLVIGA
jgi:hypothetical protein